MCERGSEARRDGGRERERDWRVTEREKVREREREREEDGAQRGTDGIRKREAESLVCVLCVL